MTTVPSGLDRCRRAAPRVRVSDLSEARGGRTHDLYPGPAGATTHADFDDSPSPRTRLMRPSLPAGLRPHRTSRRGRQPREHPLLEDQDRCTVDGVGRESGQSLVGAFEGVRRDGRADTEPVGQP